MSDTPETDAVSEMLDFKVDLDFARKLERERDEAREAFVIATDQMVVAQCKLRESNKERDEAREERDFFAEEIKRMQEHIWKLHLVISMQSKTLSKHGLEEYIL